MPEWMDGEVDNSKPALNNRQIGYLLAMTKFLREGENALETVYQIKVAAKMEDITYAQQLWDEFTEEEQNALWVAPLFGGIFTTDERDLIKNGEAE